jgi:flagellin-like protein
MARLLASLNRKRNRRSKRAVSEIIATLLMILVVVSLGVTIFAFASSGLNSFGNSFFNLFTNSGNAVQENDVIQMVTFTNTGTAGTSGVTIYIGNDGQNPTTIQTVYIQSLTSSTLIEQFSTSPLPLTINAGLIGNVFATGFVPSHGTTYQITIATLLGNTVTYNAKYT